MSEYLIYFEGSWVPDWSDDEFLERSKILRPLLAEMKAAGVFVFTGGLDDTAPVFSVEPADGVPVFTDGPYVETKEHLGGLAIVDVPDEATARYWAGRIALACGWPQEVRRFQVPRQFPGASD